MGFSPDDRIATYRVERELGSSTSGVLYQGLHLVLPRRAMIKVAHAARGQQFAVQLLREACLLEALSHPGIPAVYESGLLDDRRPWFASELIEGTTLADRMNGGPLPSSEVAALVRDLASILEHAHKRGVVHRSLRPDRVLLTGRKREIGVALADWSEARIHDSAGAPMFPAREARPYLAPEMARGEAIDDRADVYSLGVLAYHALTGALPRSTLDFAFIPTAERSPDAPRELASLIDQMLSPDRFDRPACAEIRSDLDWLANALSIELRIDDVATSGMRIRKPRWTPAIEPTMLALDPIDLIDSDDSSTVSGEIIILEVD